MTLSRRPRSRVCWPLSGWETAPTEPKSSPLDPICAGKNPHITFSSAANVVYHTDTGSSCRKEGSWIQNDPRTREPPRSLKPTRHPHRRRRPRQKLRSCPSGSHRHERQSRPGQALHRRHHRRRHRCSRRPHPSRWRHHRIVYILTRDGFEYDFMKYRSIGKQLMKLRPVIVDGGRCRS